MSEVAVKRIGIVSVPVSDQQQAKAFYTEVLGFELMSDNSMGEGRARWIQLRPKGAETSITLATWFDGMKPGGVKGLTIEVDDMDATRAALKERGLVTGNVMSEPYGKFSMFDDPDGNGWILHERPAGW